MARRRLNQTFLISAAAVAVAVPAGVAAWIKFRPKDPRRFIAAGTMYERQGDIKDAIDAYSFAAGLLPTDAGLQVKLGHLYDLMRDQDFQASVAGSLQHYTRAEELQPTLKEAWQGMLDTSMAAAKRMSQNAKGLEDQTYYLPKQIDIARDAAQHLLALDPNDSQARAAIPTLTINLWLLNLPLPLTAAERAMPADKQPTEAQQIDRAVAELTAALRDHPENPDLPMWIAFAKIEQARRLTRQLAGEVGPGGTDVGQTPGGDASALPGGTAPVTIEGRGAFGSDSGLAVRTLLNEAAVVFDDPIARQPHNAKLHFGKYLVLTSLLQVDRDPAAVVQEQRQQRAALDAAQANVTPADGPLYVEYRGRWAQYLADSDPTAAEAVYKQLLDRPTTAPAGGGAAAAAFDVQRLQQDTLIRTFYAQLVNRDPARRAEALKILDPIPTVAPEGVSFLYRDGVTRFLSSARLLRAKILTDQLQATVNPTARADLQARAQAEIDGVAANPRMAGGYDVLKAKGRLQLVGGNAVAAIQTLSAASDRLAATGGGAVDDELLDWQAQAYAAAHQSGQAIALLEKAVKNPRSANRPQPHLLLAGLYLQQQDYEHGRQQVAWLSERYPDDVRVIQLQIEALGRSPDPAAVAVLYRRLPERTAAERTDKAAWAVRTGNRADAERLLERNYAEKPGDVTTALRLAQLYAETKDVGRANVVLQQAMDAHPDARGSLQLVKDGINGASEAALQSEAEQQIATYKDPMSRETAFARLAAARGRVGDQIDHLEKARDIQPNNAAVLNDLFTAYLSSGAVDKANGMVPHLTELDADQAHGLLYKFRLAMTRHDAAGAVQAGQQLTQQFPHFASSWASLGEAQQAAGQPDAAVQQYTAALERQGNDPVVIRRLVDCLIRLGRLDDARQTLTEARRKYPDAGIYREQLVQVEVAYGDPEAVFPIVDDAVRDYPDHVNNWQTAVKAYLAAAQRRTANADADGAAKFSQHAKDLLTDALKRWPDNAVFATELGDLDTFDGTDGGIAAAADVYRALAQTPKWRNDVLPDVLLGRMYLQVHKPDQAEPPLRHALEMNPDAVDVRTTLAEVMVVRHQPEAALDVLTPVKDNNPEAKSKYVDLLLSLNRGPQAEAELLADLKASPDDPRPANLLARVYAAQGKWDAAIATADKVLAAHPRDVGANFVRGVIEASRPTPDLDAAVRDLTAFRQAFPDNLQGRTSLAQVLLARHDLDGGVAELEAAAEIAPDDKQVRIQLAKAYLSLDPPRTLDAAQVIAQALTVPRLAHDPDVQRTAATVYLKQGQADRAVASIRDAVTHSADQRALLDEYFTILLDTKHYDLLLDESAKFAGDPKAGWAVYDFRGRARAASGDANGAMAEFTTALDMAGAARDLGPSLAVANHITALLGIDRAAQLIGPRSDNSSNWKAVLAACYEQVAQTDKALTLMEPVLPSLDAFAPADRTYLTRLAGVLYMTATPPQPAKALSLFQDVLRQKPDDTDALNNVACVLATQVSPPRPDEAKTYSDRAYALVRKAGQVNPYVYDTQGWVLILTGRVDDGVDLLRQIADHADFPEAHYHLGMGYLRKSMWDDARRELDAASAAYTAAVDAHRPVDRSIPDTLTAARQQLDRAAATAAATRPAVR